MTILPLHILLPTFDEMVISGVTGAFTFMVMATEVSLAGLAQDRLEVMMQRTF